jgi:excisionase family DNA binding protein
MQKLDDPILSLKEAAEYLGRHPQTLRKAAQMKEIACIRRGRRGKYFFRLSYLERWLKGQEHPLRASKG